MSSPYSTGGDEISKSLAYTLEKLTETDHTLSHTTVPLSHGLAIALAGSHFERKYLRKVGIKRTTNVDSISRYASQMLDYMEANGRMRVHELIEALKPFMASEGEKQRAGMFGGVRRFFRGGG